MKGLLIKDFYVLVKQLKIFLVFIPLMALMGGSSLASTSILLGAVLPMTAIAYDERSKWNELALMMPYSKKDIAICKYLLGYTCMLIATMLSFLGQTLLVTFGGKLDFNINMLLFGVAAGLFFIALNTPLSFKFGVEKVRYIFIIGMVAITALAGILVETDSINVIAQSSIAPLFIFLFIIILNVVSILISIKVCDSNRK